MKTVQNSMSMEVTNPLYKLGLMLFPIHPMAKAFKAARASIDKVGFSSGSVLHHTQHLLRITHVLLNTRNSCYFCLLNAYSSILCLLAHALMLLKCVLILLRLPSSRSFVGPSTRLVA